MGEGLTRRQQAVLELAACGLSNKRIANRLGISENGVRNHLHKLFKQIGVSNRTELALWASRQVGRHDCDPYDQA